MSAHRAPSARINRRGRPPEADILNPFPQPPALAAAPQAPAAQFPQPFPFFTILFLSTPIPSISTSTSSPTSIPEIPDGVPVAMTSPGRAS